MKLFVAVLGTLIGLVVATPHKLSPNSAGDFEDTPADYEKAARALTECVRKALDGGLPSAGIPDHNPLHIKDYVFESEILNVSATNMVASNIVNFNVTDLQAFIEESETKVDFNYKISYDHLVLDCQLYIAVNIGGMILSANKSTSFNLQDVTFMGYWNMTLASDFNAHLDNFQIIPHCSLTEVIVNKTHVNFDALTDYINNDFPVDDFSSFIQSSVNDVWIANGTKIDALLDNCRQ